jgi:broad specificity phosphatase PhoE
MRIVVVRHGETVENAQDIVMGHHGGNLSENGLRQAKETAAKLKDYEFDQAWSSDLRRCVDTAGFILKHHQGLKLKTTHALREVNYGEFQGRPAAEIRLYFDKTGFDQNSKVPGGESHKEMGKRVLLFVNSLMERSPEDRILIVSHNGPIETIRAAVEHTPFTSDAENASIRTFEITQPLTLYPSP